MPTNQDALNELTLYELEKQDCDLCKESAEVMAYGQFAIDGRVYRGYMFLCSEHTEQTQSLPEEYPLDEGTRVSGTPINGRESVEGQVIKTEGTRIFIEDEEGELTELRLEECEIIT